MKPGLIVGFAVVTLIGLAAVGGGVFLIVQRETGERVKATVTSCTGSGKYESCDGSWVAGGSLVGGNGHVVLGTIDGASRDDIGKTLDVTVDGDRAYTRSLRVPIILLVLGTFVAGTGAYLPFAVRRSQARPR